jgi:hypothetical protein
MIHHFIRSILDAAVFYERQELCLFDTGQGTNFQNKTTYARFLIQGPDQLPFYVIRLEGQGVSSVSPGQTRAVTSSSEENSGVPVYIYRKNNQSPSTASGTVAFGVTYPMSGRGGNKSVENLDLTYWQGVDALEIKGEPTFSLHDISFYDTTNIKEITSSGTKRPGMSLDLDILANDFPNLEKLEGNRAFDTIYLPSDGSELGKLTEFPNLQVWEVKDISAYSGSVNFASFPASLELKELIIWNNSASDSWDPSALGKSDPYFPEWSPLEKVDIALRAGVVRDILRDFWQARISHGQAGCSLNLSINGKPVPQDFKDLIYGAAWLQHEIVSIDTGSNVVEISGDQTNYTYNYSGDDLSFNKTTNAFPDPTSSSSYWSVNPGERVFSIKDSSGTFWYLSTTDAGSVNGSTNTEVTLGSPSGEPTVWQHGQDRSNSTYDLSDLDNSSSMYFDDSLQSAGIQ